MNSPATLTGVGKAIPVVPTHTLAAPALQVRSRSLPHSQFPFRLQPAPIEQDLAQRQAELFYLQKQIQSQTVMVIVLADGEQIEGVIEWYDRYSLKVRGRQKTLIYKTAIKYMYKVGDSGQQPGS